MYRYEEARVLLTEVIGRVPNLLDPYRKLALVVEEQGDRGKALEFCMIAARMAKTVSLLHWRLASAWSMSLCSGYCSCPALHEAPVKAFGTCFNMTDLWDAAGDRCHQDLGLLLGGGRDCIETLGISSMLTQIDNLVLAPC